MAANRRQPHHHPAHLAAGQAADDLGYSDYGSAAGDSGRPDGGNNSYGDYYGGGGAGQGYDYDDGREYDGDDDICFCDDCMNVRILGWILYWSHIKTRRYYY